MTADRIFRGLFVLYLLAFVAYLFAPLLIMGVAAFNESRFPTVIPWQGTTLDWFSAMWADAAMWKALWTSAIVAVLVVVVALPVGTAAALVLTTLHSRARSMAYAVMVSPLLTPGVVIGISTLILWRQVGVGGGIGIGGMDGRLQRAGVGQRHARLDAGRLGMPVDRRDDHPPVFPEDGDERPIPQFRLAAGQPIGCQAGKP